MKMYATSASSQPSGFFATWKCSDIMQGIISTKQAWRHTAPSAPIITTNRPLGAFTTRLYHRRLLPSFAIQQGDSLGPGRDDDWDAALGALAHRMELVRRTSTAQFLQHGYQASFLEAKVEEHLESRPSLPDPTVAPPSWQEYARGRERLFEWHEDAWASVRQTVHDTEE